MNFAPRASALLTHLWVFNPFALQSRQTAQTHYCYNPLYEGYHTLFQPGDCTSSLIMEAHELVFLGDLEVGGASFIQRLGFAEQNPSKKTTTIDDQPCKIHMYETANLDEAAYRWIRGAEGGVYFYNTASRSSYEHIEAIHDKLQKIRAASTTSAPDPAISSVTSPPPFQKVLVGTVLFGTKREVSLEEGKELARKLGCKFSLETEDTVGDVLCRMIRLCREARKAQGVSWWYWGSWGSCLGWGR